MIISKPEPDEHAPFYATYIAVVEAMISQGSVPDLITLLRHQPDDLAALLDGVSASVAQSAYAPGKWTLLESLVHTMDTERVFSYRLLRAARGDRTPLASFDHDGWVPMSGAESRTIADVIDEFRTVRAASLSLLAPLDDEALTRRTVASGQDVSVRALAWMIAGHMQHHLHLIRDRYLAGPVNSDLLER